MDGDSKEEIMDGDNKVVVIMDGVSKAGTMDGDSKEEIMDGDNKAVVIMDGVSKGVWDSLEVVIFGEII